MHAHTDTHTHTRSHTHAHTDTPTHAHTHTDTHAHSHTQNTAHRTSRRPLHARERRAAGRRQPSPAGSSPRGLNSPGPASGTQRGREGGRLPGSGGRSGMGSRAHPRPRPRGLLKGHTGARLEGATEGGSAPVHSFSPGGRGAGPGASQGGGPPAACQVSTSREPDGKWVARTRDATARWLRHRGHPGPRSTSRR